MRKALPHQLSLGLSPRSPAWELRVVAFVAAAPLTKPKDRVRPRSPTSADTAQAPKKIIRKITAETTTKNVTGMGIRRAINLAHLC